MFAHSQIVALLIDEPTWSAVGQAALVFVLLWLSWSQMTLAAKNVQRGNA